MIESVAQVFAALLLMSFGAFMLFVLGMAAEREAGADYSVEVIARALCKGATNWKPWEDDARLVIAALRAKGDGG
jgi:hypothetical protein